MLRVVGKFLNRYIFYSDCYTGKYKKYNKMSSVMRPYKFWIMDSLFWPVFYFSKNGCLEGTIQRLKTYKDPALKYEVKVGIGFISNTNFFIDIFVEKTTRV